jgi:aspartyl-tRNA(Asn)/glutamyl-tRNA(Gln) amidotransferase subunit B
MAGMSENSTTEKEPRMNESSYRLVIGLEVHVQLLTRTKLFCGCPTKFGLPPNSATCPVCIGMPGALPVMNRQAVHLALRAALALNCRVSAFTKWDRKNYFYPDLPKNYQISQYDLPLATDGWLEIDSDGARKKISIIRVHLEEDAGKMLHDEKGERQDSLVDLNRAGIPLIEIVSRPDLESPEQARAYLEEIRLLLRELGVSDCEMQEGSLRCDANVNIQVHRANQPSVVTPIVEVKNLNSFRAVERALRHEADRQYQDFLQAGVATLPKAGKQTRGWDDVRGITVLQRRKEEAADYRYFPEPDLPPLLVTELAIRELRSQVGELPAAQRQRLERQYGLSPYDSSVLTRQGRAFVAYFEEVAAKCGDPKQACNWMTNEVLHSMNEVGSDINQFPIRAEAVGDLIRAAERAGLNRQRAREVYARMLETRGSAAEALDILGFRAVVDERQLRDLVRRALAANQKAVADYKRGKLKAADAIKGAVMRETKGMANAQMVELIVQEELLGE